MYGSCIGLVIEQAWRHYSDAIVGLDMFSSRHIPSERITGLGREYGGLERFVLFDLQPAQNTNAY